MNSTDQAKDSFLEAEGKLICLVRIDLPFNNLDVLQAILNQIILLVKHNTPFFFFIFNLSFFLSR
jgi:hypothetical protein